MEFTICGIKDQVIQKLVYDIVANLSKKNEVYAVFFLGGLAKYGEIDQFSDIDLGVLLESKPSENYLPSFSFNLFSRSSSYEVNLSQFILKDEIETQWSEAKKEAFKKCIVLYQKDKSLDHLLDSKLDYSSFFKNKLIDLLNQYQWRINYHALNAFERGYPISSKKLVDEGIELLTDSLFALNEVYKPHTKWIERDLMNLSLKPDDIGQKLIQLYSLGACKDEICKQIEKMNIIQQWILIRAKIKFNDFPNDLYVYWSKYLSSRQVFEKSFSEVYLSKHPGDYLDREREFVTEFLSVNLISCESEMYRLVAETLRNNSRICEEKRNVLEKIIALAN